MNRENAPTTFLSILQEESLQNGSELHSRQLRFWTHINRENLSRNFSVNLRGGEFPKYVWTFYMLWPENGFNCENMSRTSLKKIFKLSFVKFSPVKKIASKKCKCRFSKLLSAGVQKRCPKCRFFGLEGSLALGQATWAKMTPKLLPLWRQSQKIRTPNQKIFFRVQSTRLADLFASLNSSLAQSSEELWRW